ncbi:MAG: hypothetical protein KBA46_01790 [Candidatus Omnitrophica bacterium]|nr:hypothetical protein [Candidatus Omnitrophota bacterium]
MAQEKPLQSPEKELLKLIEKPMHKDSLQAATIRYHGQSFFSFGALKGRFAFLKNKFKDLKSAHLAIFDLKVINRILLVGIAVLVLYFMVSATFSFMRLKKEVSFTFKAHDVKDVKSPQVNSFLKAASFYLEKARARDIFSMSERAASTEHTMFSKGPSQKLQELVEPLRLVGISWSDDPDVMVEDTKNPRTLFLKKGQLIDGKLKVQAVFKDKVILSYNGEEIELR